MTHRLTLALRRLYRDSHGMCSRCGQKIERGGTQHLGYSANRTPIAVGDCCSSELAETAVRYVHSSREYDVPPDSAIIWRYMDFVKFTSMLSERVLFFCRGDNFEDPFEGAMGTTATKRRWDRHYKRFFAHALLNPPPGYKNELRDSEVQQEARRLLRDFSAGNSHLQRSTFVNCWYESPHESDAMWRLYSKDQAQGVAVRSTVGRLKLALRNRLDVEIGRVKYIDFDREYPSIHRPFFFKRNAFAHEREVRAMVLEFADPPAAGMRIPVNLNRLIETVHVSPFAPGWFQRLVKDTMRAFGVAKRVRRSGLAAEPFR